MAWERPKNFDDYYGKMKLADWVERFEAPDRVTWQKPADVLAALNIEVGESIVDVGAGTGYFSVPFARAVGKIGSVLAMETDPALVKHIRARAKEEKLPWLKAQHDKSEVCANLPEEHFFTAFLCNSYHMIDNRRRTMINLRENLQPWGRLVVIDWHKRALPIGPPPELKLTASRVIYEIGMSGFTLYKRHSFLPYQYFLMFRPPRPW